MTLKRKSPMRKGFHVRIYEEILSSPSYRALRPTPRALLIEFQRIYRPGRNGQLSISVKNAMQLLNVSKQTAEDAFHVLEEHGFIELTQGHLWQNGQAREWKLTIEQDRIGQEPTDDWKLWEPGKPVRSTRSKKRRA